MRRLGLAAIFLLAVVAAVAVIGGASRTASSTSPNARLSRDPMSLFDPAAPLMSQGGSLTLGEAGDEAPFPILRPTALGEPSEVWVGDLGDGVYEVGLRYADRGVVVHLARMPEGADVGRWQRARVEGLARRTVARSVAGALVVAIASAACAREATRELTVAVDVSWTTSSCERPDGVDLRGTEVLVTDRGGEAVGRGRLGPGGPPPPGEWVPSWRIRICRFRAVLQVPDRASYRVRLGDGEPITFTRTELEETGWVALLPPPAGLAAQSPP